MPMPASSLVTLHSELKQLHFEVCEVNAYGMHYCQPISTAGRQKVSLIHEIRFIEIDIITSSSNVTEVPPIFWGKIAHISYTALHTCTCLTSCWTATKNLQ